MNGRLFWVPSEEQGARCAEEAPLGRTEPRQAQFHASAPLPC